MIVSPGISSSSIHAKAGFVSNLRQRILTRNAAFLLLALAIFIGFTWRAPLMFFSGDDMMNMYKAWQTPFRDLVLSLAAFWKPAYRPAGGLVYHGAYSLFGFHPLALYCFSWAVLVANVALLYVLVARITRTISHPLVTCVIATVHGTFLDLYYSAGTIYDHLSAFFCLLALNLWVAVRLRGRNPSRAVACGILLFTIAGCDSKENAIAIPVLLFAAEFLLVRDPRDLRSRLRALIPLAISAFAAVLFIAIRTANTPDLSSNPAYHPRLDASVLLANLSTFLGYITYGAVSGPAAVIAIALAIGLFTAVLRSRVMLFGLVWFAAFLLPVAFITTRLGYVLYLPMMGFGIWFSDLLFRLLHRARIPQRLLPACAVLAASLLCLWHSSHWPQDWIPQYTPEWFTTRQFRIRYPEMPRGARLLFVNDPFPRDAWDLTFNLRLLYHDDSLVADRLLSGSPDQRPRPADAPGRYDHIFVFAYGENNIGYYVEIAPEWLDAASVRPQP